LFKDAILDIFGIYRKRNRREKEEEVDLEGYYTMVVI